MYEAHVLACLSRSVEQLVLIGDHEQLRPKPNVFELQAESGRYVGGPMLGGFGGGIGA